MQYLIPDKVYQVLKWGCVLVLPAVATFVKTVGAAWGWDPAICEATATTITAAATLGGIVLGVSAATAKKADGGDE